MKVFIIFKCDGKVNIFLAEVKPSAQHMLLLNFRDSQNNSFKDIDKARSANMLLLLLLHFLRTCMQFFLHTNNLPFF